MKIRGALSILSLTTIALTFAPDAFAHEEGAIRLNAKQLPVGGSLIVVGDRFGKGVPYRLELRGTLKTFKFGRVRTDTAGHFEFTVTLPAEATPGSYAVAAIAADGDVSARADLVIVAASAATSSGANSAMPGMANMPPMRNMPGMAGMAGMHATAEYMEIPRTTTTAQWIIIGAIIGASALLGVALLRGPKGSPEQ